MHALPLNLERLALHCSNGGHTALAGVSVTLTAGGGYRAESTDNRVFIRVEGPCVGWGEYPEIPGVEGVGQDGIAATGIVASSVWSKCFSQGRALVGTRKHGIRPELVGLAVQFGNSSVTLAATDGEQTVVRKTATVEGTFPDGDSVFPKGPATDRVWIDPLRLAELLKTAAEFCAGCPGGAVVIETRGGGPIVVRTTAPNDPKAQRFVAVLMPMAAPVGHPLAPVKS